MFEKISRILKTSAMKDFWLYSNLCNVPRYERELGSLHITYIVVMISIWRFSNFAFNRQI